jgi:5'-phosphate synthase pdxT subunit
MTADRGPVNSGPLVVGILALQGAYAAHAQRVAGLGANPRLVRTSAELDGLDGLIMPGGESTTMLKFLERNGFFEVLQEWVRGTPTFGTCAGAILLAAHVENPPQRSLGAMDITVERNAYGRQIDSTILTAETALPGGPLEMVFIRAPRIKAVGPGVETLAAREGFPTLVRAGHLLAASFHPELSADARVHEYFLGMIVEHKAAG